MSSKAAWVLIACSLGLGGGRAWGADPSTLEERATAIEHVSTEPDGTRVVLGHLSRKLHIPSDTLRAQRTQTGLNWGELLIAHRLGEAKGLAFDEAVVEFKGGKSWETIARDHGVDLSKLAGDVQRSQEIVEGREEDRSPNLETSPSSGHGNQGGGGGVPGGSGTGGSGKGRRQSGSGSSPGLGY
ncbi:MAG TPA: hypothetical protein VEL75_19135 [Candidatus Methylomirabilis sp.]|nr:hypothetical protein [Candidatus Methylomirabilis sp.]